MLRRGWVSTCALVAAAALAWWPATATETATETAVEAGSSATEASATEAIKTETISAEAIKTEAGAGETRCHRPSAEETEICISKARYAQDICGALALYADRAGLPRGFFARLIWQESRFNPSAVSPMNAQGVAQFIPGTAALRGLKDPFNPAEALLVSALYLRELRDKFGNLGMAAVAYNAGEGRAARLRAGDSFAPGETRRYVSIITGHEIEAWLAEPPPKVNFALRPGEPFRPACVRMATTATFKRFAPKLYAAPPKPWGVEVAIHARPAIVRRLFQQVTRTHRGVIGGERLIIVREKRGPRGRLRRYAAQIGRDSRAAALSLCRKLRARGGVCRVVRN